MSGMTSDMQKVSDWHAAPRAKSHTSIQNISDVRWSSLRQRFLPTIQNPAEHAGLNSTTLTIVGITVCSASPLAHGFLPVAKQRRQEIVQDHSRSGLDLHGHRHAG
jgi:hypothetical protein